MLKNTATRLQRPAKTHRDIGMSKMVFRNPVTLLLNGQEEPKSAAYINAGLPNSERTLDTDNKNVF